MNCPHCDTEMELLEQIIEGWPMKATDVVFECQNEDCVFLTENTEPYWEVETDEDRAADEADYRLDQQKDEQ